MKLLSRYPHRGLALLVLLLPLLAGCGQAPTGAAPTAPASAGATAAPAAEAGMAADSAAVAPTADPAPSLATSAPAVEPVRVIATTSIIADLVANVGGERVVITTLLPVGSDPHTYAPTPADARAISEAQLVFANGVGLEEWLGELIANAGGERPLVEVAEGLPVIAGGAHAHAEEEEHAHAEEEHAHAEETAGAGDAAHAEEEHAHAEETAGAGDAAHAEEEHAHAEETAGAGDAAHAEGDGHDHAAGDPHMWFDVSRAIHYVEQIEAGLIAVDPVGQADYAANAAAYRAQLETLDSWIKEQVAQLPQDRRKLVTSHDTFQYFAERYGFEVVGTVFSGISSDQEPSAQELAALITRIQEANIPAVFTENTINSRLAEQVANEAGVSVVTQLYTDSLGEPGSDGESYESMMRFNVTTIVAALK